MIDSYAGYVLACTRMAYQEPKKRSIRLDDDVYEALRKLPESPNKFLRKVLSAGSVFQPQATPPENLVFLKEPLTNYQLPRKPLLKPKERTK